LLGLASNSWHSSLLNPEIPAIQVKSLAWKRLQNEAFRPNHGSCDRIKPSGRISSFRLLIGSARNSPPACHPLLPANLTSQPASAPNRKT
jgi:hypothetical protein